MKYSKISAVLLTAAALTLSAACSDNKAYEMAICALADTSGTYASQRANVARIIKAGIVSQMQPGDSLFFITIDSNSYSKDNLIDNLHLAYVPSQADAQRLAFAKVLDKFARGTGSSQYTDISGAMLLCSDYLNSTGAGKKAMLVFSDMQEDLQSGLHRKFDKNQFNGVNVAAMNVIQLKHDSADPAEFKSRLKHWNQRLKSAGAASWRVLLDPVDIPDYLQKLR